MTNSVAASALDRFIARAGDLYSLPAVAVKVIELTESPKVDVRELKSCIENDPALTTRILRVVNSSLFGLTREVSDLNQALALLGTKPLKLLVLGFSLPDAMFEGIEAEVLSRYWQRALTRSVAARDLCTALGRRQSDEAFIAGLLAGVGVLVLVRELGDPYVKFLARAEAEQTDLAALEAASLGFTYQQLSAGLLEHWRLPEAIVAAVDASQSLERVEAVSPPWSELSAIVYIADRLTEVLVDKRHSALQEVLTMVHQRFAWTSEQIAAFVATLEGKVAQLAGVLALALPNGASYTEILAAAQRRLAGVAAEAAPDVVRAERARAQRDQYDEVAHETQSLVVAVDEFLNRGRRSQPTVRPVPMPPPSSRPTQKHAKLATTITATVAIEPALESRVAASVAACRAERQPLSLMLVAIDHLGDLAFAIGPSGVARTAELLIAVLRRLDQSRVDIAPAGDGVWAALLGDCDRDLAVELANHVVTAVSRLRPAVLKHDEKVPLSISVGVATVALAPRNFPASVLLERASRCLYAAQSSGGNVAKSIEIY